jgi:predicted RNA-binding protein with PUA-like domain
MRHWLMKSEPSSYSIDDLEREGRTCWNGVRNYQARNLMRDEVKRGDLVLFHHSSADPPAVVGVARVAREGYPDHTARDPESPYFDSRADEGDPRWYMVDIEFVERFRRPVPMARLRSEEALAEMPLLNRSRLSVQPVTAEEFRLIRRLGQAGG